jgi:hypothetical protein
MANELVHMYAVDREANAPRSLFETLEGILRGATPRGPIPVIYESEGKVHHAIFRPGPIRVCGCELVARGTVSEDGAECKARLLASLPQKHSRLYINEHADAA